MLKLLSCFLFFLLCIGGLTVSASSRPTFVIETPSINHNINVLKQGSPISFLVKKRNQALDRILLQSNHPELIPDRFISLDKSVVEVELDISKLDFSRTDSLRISLIDPKTLYKNERDLFWAELGKFFASSCKVDLKQLKLSDTDEIICGDVVVPENRSTLDSRAIVIHTAKILGSEPDMTPIVSLEGGPGGPFDLASYLDLIKKNFNAGRTLILIDQRGVGASSPVPECSITVKADYAEQIRELQACVENKWSSKIDLSSYNTQENADDIADVLRAYGFDKAVIFGVSYGSRLGLELMRRHPQIIEASLLSAIAAPGDDYIFDVNKPISDSLQNVLALCKADENCDSSYPNLELELNKLLVQGNQLSQELWSKIFGKLYAKSGVETIPKTIYKAKNKKPKPIEIPKKQKEVLMYISTICSDNYSLYDFEKAQSDQSAIPIEWQEFLKLGSFDDICKDVPYKNLGADYYKTINSQIPTLIIQGVLDHVTPLEDAIKLNSQLSNSRLIQFPEGFHSVTIDNDCGLKILQDFFTDLQKDNIDAACANDTKLEFVIPKSKSKKSKSSNRIREYNPLFKRF